MASTDARREEVALSNGPSPTWQPLQPEATGVAMEVTKLLTLLAAVIWRFPFLHHALVRDRIRNLIKPSDVF